MLGVLGVLGVLGAVGVVVGCGTESAREVPTVPSARTAATSSGGPNASPSARPSASVHTTGGLPAPFATLARAYCRDEARCAGPTAQVTVWTDEAGEPRRMVWSGDLATCSHVMTWVLDERGRELMARNDKPVSAERAEVLQREWRAMFEGLRESTRTTCAELGP